MENFFLLCSEYVKKNVQDHKAGLRSPDSHQETQIQKPEPKIRTQVLDRNPGPRFRTQDLYSELEPKIVIQDLGPGPRFFNV